MILDDDKHITNTILDNAPITPELLNHLGWVTTDPENGFVFEHLYFNFSKRFETTHITRMIGMKGAAEDVYYFCWLEKGKQQNKVISNYKDYLRVTNDFRR